MASQREEKLVSEVTKGERTNFLEILTIERKRLTKIEIWQDFKLCGLRQREEQKVK